MKLPSVRFDSEYRVGPHDKVRLKDVSTGYSGKLKESDADKALDDYRKTIGDLQERLYASQQGSLLIVLQGMDTAGKDGTIRHIFTGVNPAGCIVQPFKVPTALEARHDFLWRVHAATPPKGFITIFNRSHYEDVLAPRVHGLVDEKTAQMRFDQINDFERLLASNGTVIVKFFLHISKKEQRARLQARIDDKSKHWKLSAADFHERLKWDGYQTAYQDILRHTSKPHAPWYIIPSDQKWYRNVAISNILRDVMKSMKLSYPKSDVDISTLKL